MRARPSDRAGGLRPEPQASQPKALIPRADHPKDIRSKADRRWKPSRIPSQGDPDWGDEAAAEAFARDWTRNCDNCAATPVVNATGMCGPCTFGESETYGGNW